MHSSKAYQKKRNMIVTLELNVQLIVSIRSDISINQYSSKSFHRIDWMSENENNTFIHSINDETKMKML